MSIIIRLSYEFKASRALSPKVLFLCGKEAFRKDKDEAQRVYNFIKHSRIIRAEGHCFRKGVSRRDKS